MKKRILCTLLVLVLLFSIAPILPRAEAVTKKVKGNINLSSYSNNDILELTGNTTLTVDANVCLYGIVSQKTDGHPAYNLTIQGSGSTYMLSIGGWHNECIYVNNLEIKNTRLDFAHDRVYAYGTLKCSNTIWSLSYDRAGVEYLLQSVGDMTISSSTLKLNSNCAALRTESTLTLNNSTVTVEVDGNSDAIGARNLAGSGYTIKAKGGHYGMCLFEQSSQLKPTLIDVYGPTAGIWCPYGSLSCASTNILYPVNGTCNGKTVKDSSGSFAKRVVLGENRSISGTVYSSDTTPVCTCYLYPRYSGAIENIPDEDRIVVWQRSANGSSGWVDLPEHEIQNHGYPCGQEDVDQYLRLKVKAIGYNGTLYSAAYLVKKAPCTASPTAPTLKYTSNNFYVTNASTDQEYFVSTTYYTTIPESCWAKAQVPTSQKLYLEYTGGKTNYVYTRIRETSWRYASSTFAYSSLFCTINKPVITVQPQSMYVSLGSSVVFYVTATTTQGAPLSYQWQYKKTTDTGWHNWTGKTEHTLPVVASSTNNGCQYRCIVTNSAGSVTSDAATLTVSGVTGKPSISKHPASLSAAIGKTVTFEVVASGSGLKYQWQYKKADATSWTSWSGKTASTLSVTASSTNGGCQYRCVVSNSAGSVTSNAATLTVTGGSTAKPTITTNPSAAKVPLGTAVSFKVVASGSGLSYQWQFSKDNGATWSGWSGKTSPTLSVTASKTNNGCLYRCKVSNSAGSVTSSSARLTVSNIAPTIVVQPVNASVALGKTTTMKVVAAGSGLTYQWQFSKNNGANWYDWSGKTDYKLEITGSSTNNGCLYRCVVKNTYGSVTSASAKLTVN